MTALAGQLQERPAADAYAALKRGIALHRTAEGGTLLIPIRGSFKAIVRPESDGGVHFDANDFFKIDGYLADYLSLLDGQTPKREIDERVGEDYGPLFGPMLALQAWSWVCEHPELVTVRTTPLAQPRKARMTGTADGFHPVHCSLEIIETCNFTCDHCYYQSSPLKTGRLTLERATEIMDTLAARGVRVLELTGGECTIHPDFMEILDHACATFDLVGVITNGYRLGTDARLADAVCTKENIMVQVSIDAIGERHDEFRKHRRAFSAAVEAVKRLQRGGVVTRIASSISEANIDQVEALFMLGKSLGVQKHSFAPVAPIGRGCNITDPGAGSKAIFTAIVEALEPHSDDPVLNNYTSIPAIADDCELPRNCGAGWRTVAIDYNGFVRACNYSRDSKKFGNILTDDYDVLFGQEANFYFQNAPSPGGRDCVGCDYYLHCRGCFVKAFMVSETVYPECPWRRHWFPNMSLALDPARHQLKPKTEILQALPEFSEQDSPQICGSCAEGDGESVSFSRRLPVISGA